MARTATCISAQGSTPTVSCRTEGATGGVRGCRALEFGRFQEQGLTLALVVAIALAMAGPASAGSGGASTGPTSSGSLANNCAQGQPVRHARDVDLGADALRRRQPRDAIADGARARHQHAVHQERRRDQHLVAVQLVAGVDAARARPAGVRVAVRLRQQPDRRGLRRRRCRQGRRRLPRDRRRERVRGQVRVRADLRHARCAADRRQLPGRRWRASRTSTSTRRSPTRCSSVRAARSTTRRRCTGRHRHLRRRRLSRTRTSSTGIYERTIDPARADLQQPAPRPDHALPSDVAVLRGRRA